MIHGVLGEVASSTLGNVLSSVGEVFTSGLGWVGDIANTVASEPLLLIGCLIPFIGLGIGLFQSLTNR